MDSFFDEAQQGKKSKQQQKERSGGGNRSGNYQIADEKIDHIIYMIYAILITLALTQLGVFKFIGGGLASAFEFPRFQGWVDMLAILFPYGAGVFAIYTLRFEKKKF